MADLLFDWLGLSNLPYSEVSPCGKYASTLNLRTLKAVGSTAVWLTSCLTGLKSITLHRLNQHHFYFFVQSQTSQTRGEIGSATYLIK